MNNWLAHTACKILTLTRMPHIDKHAMFIKHTYADRLDNQEYVIEAYIAFFTSVQDFMPCPAISVNSFFADTFPYISEFFAFLSFIFIQTR